MFFVRLLRYNTARPPPPPDIGGKDLKQNPGGVKATQSLSSPSRHNAALCVTILPCVSQCCPMSSRCCPVSSRCCPVSSQCCPVSSLGLAVRGGNTECTDTGCLGTVHRYGSKCTGIPEPTQGEELSLSVSLSLTRTHMHARAHTHRRAHAHTHFPHPPPPPPPRTYLFPSFYLHVTSSSYLPSVSVYRSCQYALGSATRNPLNLA